MFLTFQGPEWLFGIDVGIQLIGAIIALLISLYGYKLYKLSSTKTDLYFSLAFLLFGLSFFIYVFLVPAVYIYYNYFSAVDPGLLLKGSHLLNFIFIFLTLGAYAILNLVYSKIKNPNAILTVFILIFALDYFLYYSRSSFGLSIISALLALLITINVFKNYAVKRNKNSLFVVIAFALMTLANVFFGLGSYINISFLFGHITQLLGYSSLLIMLLRINYGHRKKK